MIQERSRLRLQDWQNLMTLAILQTMAAIGLRIVGVETLRTQIARWRAVAQALVRGPEARIVWAIEASGCRLFGASTCLVRALVGDLVLGSRERPLRLTIGVRQSAGRFESHAWLGRDGRVIIGGACDRFSPIAAWDSVFR